MNKLMVPGQKLYSLPFDVVLNNNVALSYFIGKHGRDRGAVAGGQ